MAGLNSASAPLPSAPATTTASFLVTNDDEDDESLDGLLLETSDTTTASGDEKPEPYRRIVGGDLVIPGEIPWQVLRGESTATEHVWRERTAIPVPDLSRWLWCIVPLVSFSAAAPFSADAGLSLLLTAC